MNIENVEGSNQDDVIVGDNWNNVIYGFDGNDHILGLDGDDYIYPGNGENSIDGGLGNDTVDYSGLDVSLSVIQEDLAFIAQQLNHTFESLQKKDTLEDVENILCSRSKKCQIMGNSNSNILEGSD